jgi:fibro-slime domain-containing protein
MRCLRSCNVFVPLFFIVASLHTSPNAYWFEQYSWSNGPVSDDDSVLTVESCKVKVTYYDFHNDGSNPDFVAIDTRLNPAKRITFGDIKGMVMDTLGPDRKPVPSSNDTLHLHTASRCIDRWYRQWEAGDTVTIFVLEDTLIEVYRDSTAEPDTIETIIGTSIEYPLVVDTTFLPPDTMSSDTLYKNIMIEDSIEFIGLPYRDILVRGLDSMFRPVYDTTVYPAVFWTNSRIDSFFPIDGRGLPYEPDTLYPPHNYGFSMELHNSFVYKGGEVLNVITDDDGWVFINNKLVVDHGGLHGAIPMSLLFLDSLGLEKGATYNFDAFLAERGKPRTTFLLATDIEFLEKAEGPRTVYLKKFPAPSPTVRGPLQDQSTFPGNFLLGGGTVRLNIPRGTAWMRVSILDAEGRTAAGPYRISPAYPLSPDGNHGRPLPDGTYIFHAVCHGADGGRMGVCAFPLVRLK